MSSAVDRTEPGETPELHAGDGVPVFRVQLVNFSGPFDLLLTLISRRELDITEVALAQITDEFIAHIRNLQATGGGWRLDEASEFLVVAATLLDLKAARLLPSGAVEDEEDVALLEARDLLFARLLQYRAFKEMARQLDERLADEGERHPRNVPLEVEFTRLLPELTWRHSPEQFAELAARVLTFRAEVPAEVNIEHLHSPPVSVRDQVLVLQDRLRGRGSLSFRQLTGDAGSRQVLVVRFLALLELFRDGAIVFDQAAPLTELRVTWTGEEIGLSGETFVSDFEQSDGAREDGGQDGQSGQDGHDGHDGGKVHDD